MSVNISLSPRTADKPEETELLPLGGITPFTSIDFPGRLAAVLYTRGCTWRCRYCHNAHLWAWDAPRKPWAEAVSFLDARKEFLEGVVFSGGEPTLHNRLPEAMDVVRKMGYEIGLHTTGMYPDRLAEVLKRCDWVGMDIKAPLHGYEKVTRVPWSAGKIAASVDIVMNSGVSYEFRTTVHPALLSGDDILEIARSLWTRGAQHYALQAFRSAGCRDEELNGAPQPFPFISAEIMRQVSRMFETFKIRR